MLVAFVSTFFINTYTFADTLSNPCSGPSALLNLVNRPTFADSVCVVPFKEAMLEAGYQYLNLKGGGSGQNYPEPELRIGLPLNTEFVAVLPNYNLQTVSPRSGYNANAIGIKHELGYYQHWIGAIEGFLTLPTGGGAFGSNKYDPVVNGIVSYSVNPALSLSFMLGIGSQSVPPLEGGGKYTTVNPFFVVSWFLSDSLETYGEIYGQSRVGPRQGAGFNADFGVIYALLKKVEVDAEFGHRISGSLDHFNNYYGFGLSMLI